MGAKSTSSKLSINSSEWIPLSLNSHYRKDYGKYQIYYNKINGKVIEKFDIFINDQEEYQQFQKVLLWRNNCEYVVGIDYHQFQKQQQICSTGYNGQIFIPHMPLRLSDITDIPYPQNLYVLLAILKGFQYIFSYPYILHNFQINQNLICVNQRGQVKVWMNVNLSYNFPDKFKKENVTQQQILKSIIQLVQQNTDAEGSAYPFRQYLNDRKIVVNGDFDQIIRQLHNYSKQMNTKIPSMLYSVKQLLFLNSDMPAKTEEITQLQYNQHKENKNQNKIEELQNRNINQQYPYKELQQNSPVLARTIRPKQNIKIPQIYSQNISNLPVQFNNPRQNVYQNINTQNQQIRHFNKNQNFNDQNKQIKNVNYRQNDILQTPSFGLIKSSFQNNKVRSISENYGNNILIPYTKNINNQKQNYVSEFTYPEGEKQKNFKPRQQDKMNSLEYNLPKIYKNQYVQPNIVNQSTFVQQNPSLIYPNQNIQNKITFNQKANPNMFHKVQNMYPTTYNNPSIFRSNNMFAPPQIGYHPMEQMIQVRDGRIISQSNAQYQNPQVIRSNSFQHKAFGNNVSNLENRLGMNSNIKNIGTQNPSFGYNVVLNRNAGYGYNPVPMQSNNVSRPTQLNQSMNGQVKKGQHGQLKQNINKQMNEDLNKIQNSKDMTYFLSKYSEQALDPDIAADLVKYLT